MQVSCRIRFLWTHKEVDLTPNPVVGLVLQVGDAENFPHTHGFENLDPFFRDSKQDPCFTAIEENGADTTEGSVCYKQQGTLYTTGPLCHRPIMLTAH